ncbi:hypothetical protein [Weeksella virosa]|uniref:Lipoprotein n=1 Tax=Weeksella virosa (strain ATCC 43766 / DSM 16922 / JCM 21250 / CCUG 30538 / CDC 9751 / IAM 14551 / NBRC 16016 / NCTC 11634 / CL345/78) TaxID=865938 RepID=F0NYB6_WEEVC|nr:hypothetical protein [Weeksella virosa]ADX68113.1 hypothetical protein Weevi_1412 [Weeksella virosa DSM 16922]VEH64252.1 Uncharacterised protein [Weeksella virosa]
MTRRILSLGMITLSLNAYSQVGVNTEKPTETLDVKGTIRIQELPKNQQENAIYNGDSTKKTKFTATRTVVADDNGVLGYMEDVDPVDNDGEDLNVRSVSMCSKSFTPQEIVDLRQADGGVRLKLGDYEFSWWRSSYAAWSSSEGNYFRFKKISTPYRYNSWSIAGAPHDDNGEQDNMGTPANRWSRFTRNFNETPLGYKVFQELLIIDNGDTFRFNGYMFRSQASPGNFQIRICMAVEKLVIGQGN